MAKVVLAGADTDGLPAMVAGLIDAAIADPARARLLDAMRGTVAIVVPDAEVAVTLRFSAGTCAVSTGNPAHCDVRLTMPAETLLELSAVPLLLGVPSVRDPRGRAFTRDVVRGRVRISGMRHLLLLTRLNRLLSVAS